MLVIPPDANLSDGARQRVEESANKLCGTCKTRRWRLTKRQFSGGWHVWIQCVECGNTSGQAFPKREHPRWPDYPEFDREQYDNWHREKSERESVERHDLYQIRSAEYAEWIATSPQWKEMRKRVLARAKNLCEACLDKPAEDVHHRTYDLGKLPPAYLLVALCHPCHERFHTTGDEWGPQVVTGHADTSAGYSEEDEDFEGEDPFE